MSSQADVTRLRAIRMARTQVILASLGIYVLTFVYTWRHPWPDWVFALFVWIYVNFVDAENELRLKRIELQLGLEPVVLNSKID